MPPKRPSPGKLPSAKRSKRVVVDESESDADSVASEASLSLLELRKAGWSAPKEGGAAAVSIMTDELQAEVDAFNALYASLKEDKKDSSFVRGASPKILIPLFRGWTFDQNQTIRRKQSPEGKDRSTVIAPELSLAAIALAKKAGIPYERGLVAQKDVPRLESIIRRVRMTCAKLEAEPSPLYDRSVLFDWYEHYFMHMDEHRETVKADPKKTLPDTPFLSWSEGTDAAITYAAGIPGSQQFHAVYAKDGRLKHPHIGVVVVALLSPDQLMGYQLRQHQGVHTITPHPIYKSNMEFTMKGGVEQEFIVHKELLSLPPLQGPYHPEYLEYYGLSENDYKTVKAKFVADPGKQEELIQKNLLPKIKHRLSERLMWIAQMKAHEREHPLARLQESGAYTLDLQLRHQSLQELAAGKDKTVESWLTYFKQARQSPPLVLRAQQVLRPYGKASSFTMILSQLEEALYHGFCMLEKKRGLSTFLKLIARQLIEKKSPYQPILLSHEDLSNCHKPARKGDKTNYARWLYEMVLRHYTETLPVPVVIDKMMEDWNPDAVVWLVDDLAPIETYRQEVQAVIQLILAQKHVVIGSHDPALILDGFQALRLPSIEKWQDGVIHYYRQHPCATRLREDRLLKRLNALSAWLNDFMVYPGALQSAVDFCLDNARVPLSPIMLLKSIYAACSSPEEGDPAIAHMQSKAAGFATAKPSAPEVWSLCKQTEWHDIAWLYPFDLIAQGAAQHPHIEAWIAHVFSKAPASLLEVIDVLRMQVKIVALLLGQSDWATRACTLSAIANLQTQLLSFFDHYVNEADFDCPVSHIDALALLIGQTPEVNEALKLNVQLHASFITHLATQDWMRIYKLTHILAHTKGINAGLIQYVEEQFKKAPEQYDFYYRAILSIAEFSQEEINAYCTGLYWAIEKSKILRLEDFYGHPGSVDLTGPFILHGYSSASALTRFYVLAKNFRLTGLPRSALDAVIKHVESGDKTFTTLVMLTFCSTLKKHPIQHPYYEAWWRLILTRDPSNSSEYMKKAKLIATEALGAMSIAVPPVPPQAALLPWAGAGGGAESALQNAHDRNEPSNKLNAPI